MNPTSEELKNIFYSGFPQGASWDVLDELAVAIYNGALIYKKTTIASTEIYQKTQDTVMVIEGLGPQEKGHMALKKIAKQWLMSQRQNDVLFESEFDGLHPDVRTSDGRFIIECGTTDPSCVRIFLNDERVVWIGNLPYPFYEEKNLELHMFSRGSKYETWQEEKLQVSRQTFQRFHRK
ncbi:MAG: hypothetical protein NT149_02775 [Candidatus Gottesmanbacteria bacterium]|nr:hypothetical protein [Candidatus Gottesmanbacteria bacterium]